MDERALASLVDALLELSQLRAGAVPVRPELNTLDDLVGTALQKAESVLRSHPVNVDLGSVVILLWNSLQPSQKNQHGKADPLPVAHNNHRGHCPGGSGQPVWAVNPNQPQ